ncbi:hypothetical protein MKW94_021983 [Papaver nudicaule]|uniref:Uncharacterized protein n=1 Tax=Papaver nudicaule TaxID=74823 RepID=A0AA41VS33_PAPNU|nr:hypothetical protein [Papaver nudicaule]
MIPTRAYWLSLVLDDWGTTDEEIEEFVEINQFDLFSIEVCGSDKGYGVLLRDEEKNPIIAISKSDCVSRFYHELKGVSVGLKLALKYNFFHFEFDCISQNVAGYVMQTWAWKNRCSCPPRHDLKNPGKMKYYCVECSKWRLYQVGEKDNVDKILPLIDEIMYDALKIDTQEYPGFSLSCTTSSKAKAVCHLANMELDQELRIDDINNHDELAEILYKDVYEHGTEEELILKYNLEIEEEELKQSRYA